MRKAIVNLRSDKPQPPRFCDAIIDNGVVMLEVKKDKENKETIFLEDLLYQIDIAKEMAKKE